MDTEQWNNQLFTEQLIKVIQCFSICSLTQWALCNYILLCNLNVETKKFDFCLFRRCKSEHISPNRYFMFIIMTCMVTGVLGNLSWHSCCMESSQRKISWKSSEKSDKKNCSKCSQQVSQKGLNLLFYKVFFFKKNNKKNPILSPGRLTFTEFYIYI